MSTGPSATGQTAPTRLGRLVTRRLRCSSARSACSSSERADAPSQFVAGLVVGSVLASGAGPTNIYGVLVRPLAWRLDAGGLPAFFALSGSLVGPRRTDALPVRRPAERHRADLALLLRHGLLYLDRRRGRAVAVILILSTAGSASFLGAPDWRSSPSSRWAWRLPCSLVLMIWGPTASTSGIRPTLQSRRAASPPMALVVAAASSLPRSSLYPYRRPPAAPAPPGRQPHQAHRNTSTRSGGAHHCRQRRTSRRRRGS